MSDSFEVATDVGEVVRLNMRLGQQLGKTSRVKEAREITYPSAWRYNEYGHFDLDGPRAQKLRDVEWKTFQAAKRAWDEHDRRAGREPPSPQDLRYYW